MRQAGVRESRAKRTNFRSPDSALRESPICKLATSEEKPRSASNCSRLAASASGKGGSSVCVVKIHFSGRPTTQRRSCTPAASSWLRISRPASSGAALSGSRVSATENAWSFCNPAFGAVQQRRRRVWRRRARDRAGSWVACGCGQGNFKIRFHGELLASRFCRAFSPSAQPSRLRSWRYKNFRRPVADIENEFHAPVPAPEGADGRDIGGKLITVGGEIIPPLQRPQRGVAGAESIINPRDRIQDYWCFVRGK